MVICLWWLWLLDYLFDIISLIPPVPSGRNQSTIWLSMQIAIMVRSDRNQATSKKLFGNLGTVGPHGPYPRVTTYKSGGRMRCVTAISRYQNVQQYHTYISSPASHLVAVAEHPVLCLLSMTNRPVRFQATELIIGPRSGQSGWVIPMLHVHSAPSINASKGKDKQK